MHAEMELAALKTGIIAETEEWELITTSKQTTTVWKDAD
jgi:hypothetical protein